MNNENTYLFISQICNELLTQCSGDEGEFYNTIQTTSNRIKTTTRTMLSRGRGSYSKIVAQKTLRNLESSSVQVLKSQSKKLFDELFRNSIQDLSKDLQAFPFEESAGRSNSSLLLRVVEALDDKYRDLKHQMEETKRQTKMRELHNILSFQLFTPSESMFVQEIFGINSQLKSFIEEFEYEDLLTDQLSSITSHHITPYLTSYDLPALLSERKKSKKNKKNKKKKQKLVHSQTGAALDNQKETKAAANNHCKAAEQNCQQVVCFLESVKISEQRLPCSLEQQWVSSLSNSILY